MMSGESGRRDPTATASYKGFLPYLLLLAFCFIVYCNTYNNPFLFDDLDAIVSNIFLQSWKNIPSIFMSNFQGGVGEHSRLYRPFSVLVYLILFQSFGLSTVAFHLLNVILHAVNACLGYRLGTQLGFRAKAVLAGVLIWAVHPIQTEAVDYMSQTHDLWVFGFCLLGLLALKEWQPRNVLRACLCLILGLLSKETAIMFPVLAMSLIFLHGEARWSPRSYVKTWPFWLIAVIYFAVKLWSLQASGLGSFHTDDGHTEHLAYRLYTFLATLPSYLALLIYPHQLHMERDFQVYRNLLAWPVMLGAGLLLLMSLAVFDVKSKKATPLAWGILWAVATYLPYAGLVMPVNGYFYEHWMYMPSFGLAIGLAATVDALLPQAGILRQKLPACVGLLVFILGVMTLKQNAVWSDPVRFYTNIIAAGEMAPRAHNNLGTIYFDRGDVDNAIAEYETSIRNSVNYALPYYNLGAALFRKSQSPDSVKAAIQDIQVSAALDPNFAPAHDALDKLINFQSMKTKPALHK